MGYYPSVNINCILLLHLLLSIHRPSSQSCDWFLSRCVLRNFTPYDISSMTIISHWICNCYSVVHQAVSWLAYILAPSYNLQNILSCSKWMKTYSLMVFVKKIELSIPAPKNRYILSPIIDIFWFHLTIPKLSIHIEYE